MVSLVIFVMHGSAFHLKMVTKPTLNIPSILTIGVFYNIDGGLVEINGSPSVTRLLANKNDWFDSTVPGPFALFSQLFDQVMKRHHFDSPDIYLFGEGNLGKEAGESLSPVLINIINYTRPGTAILPSGTPACNQFIHYWMRYYNYAALDLGQAFIEPIDYYTEEELTEEKIASLNAVIATLPSITCTAPRIATFNKARIIDSVRCILGIRTAAVSPIPTSPPQEARLSPVLEGGGNRIYHFEEISQFVIPTSSRKAVALTEASFGLLLQDASADGGLSHTVSISETSGSIRLRDSDFNFSDIGVERVEPGVIQQSEGAPRLDMIPENTPLSRASSKAHFAPTNSDLTEQDRKEISKKQKPRPAKAAVKNPQRFKLFGCCGDDSAVVAPLPIGSQFIPGKTPMNTDGGQIQDTDTTNLERTNI